MNLLSLVQFWTRREDARAYATCIGILSGISNFERVIGTNWNFQDQKLWYTVASKKNFKKFRSPQEELQSSRIFHTSLFKSSFETFRTLKTSPNKSWAVSQRVEVYFKIFFLEKKFNPWCRKWPKLPKKWKNCDFC